MKKTDANGIGKVVILLSKCRDGCPPAVIKDAIVRLSKLTDKVKAKAKGPKKPLAEFPQFIKDNYKRIKAANPRLDPPAIMRLAGKEYQKAK